MKKHILIINTGGTISCVKTANGYSPIQGYVESALAKISVLFHSDMPNVTIHEYNPLLDSSNMSIIDWNQIATDITFDYDKYDGFVVFHGTDTMAYTATALSFMLENLNKPVILTGSQIPLSEVRNDAVDNIITSLWICAHLPINEVCIYFNQRLLRGNRTQKISSTQLNAFDSPNFPDLAEIGTEITPRTMLQKTNPTNPLRLQTISPHFIANFRLFPGCATDVLGYLLQKPLRGLVLETYGAGNGPNNDPVFLNLLREASTKGVVIVNCTQCQHGRVEMNQYATGHGLMASGLISGHDMTFEAVHCKLLYLLSKYDDITQIKRLMEQNLSGELTPL